MSFSCYNASFIQRKDHRSDKYNTRSMFLAAMHQYCEKTENCSMKGQYHEQVWHAMCCYLAWMDALSDKDDKKESDRMHAWNVTIVLSFSLMYYYVVMMTLNSYSSFYLIMHRLYSGHRKLLFVVQLTSSYILTYQRQSSTWPGFQIFFHARMCHF